MASVNKVRMTRPPIELRLAGIGLGEPPALAGIRDFCMAVRLQPAEPR